MIFLEGSFRRDNTLVFHHVINNNKEFLCTEKTIKSCCMLPPGK
jgi:hypothetical protein